MDYHTWHVDEYEPKSLQGNKFAPVWPFRMVVSGSSDSGKTTMIMNLLMGNKKLKEDGERYILCNDVVLIGKHLHEPKWVIVKDFYNKLAEEGEDVSFKTISPSDIPDVEEFDPRRSTVVVFEDLMNMPKKIQERIADYFSSGRHSNISPIYVSQRFFLIYKTIRDNATYISLHRGSGNLPDIKRIISQYTEESESLAPVIDDLTLKKEFIVFDLRRSRTDPLYIRVRWDTSLRSILDQSSTNLGSILDQSSTNLESINEVNVIDNSLSFPSRFSSYGQKAIAQAKKDNLLIEFARNMPDPKMRKKLLGPGIRSVKNSNVWARYVYREAFGIVDKDLGPGWTAFSKKISTSEVDDLPSSGLASLNEVKKQKLARYKELLASRPLSGKKLLEGLKILLWFIENDLLEKADYIKGVNELTS
jgi:hypothetical protein